MKENKQWKWLIYYLKMDHPPKLFIDSLYGFTNLYTEFCRFPNYSHQNEPDFTSRVWNWDRSWNYIVLLVMRFMPEQFTVFDRDSICKSYLFLGIEDHCWNPLERTCT